MYIIPQYIPTYALWNNKGGVGKSYLTFQIASEYARTHASENILVIDMGPQANSSSMLLGGMVTGEAGGFQSKADHCRLHTRQNCEPLPGSKKRGEPHHSGRRPESSRTRESISGSGRRRIRNSRVKGIERNTQPGRMMFQFEVVDANTASVVSGALGIPIIGLSAGAYAIAGRTSQVNQTQLDK